MKINLTSVIKDYQGNPVKNEGEPVTYRDAIWISLNNYLPNEQPTPEEKLKAFKISTKIMAEKAELSVEDMGFIGQRIGIISSPLVYGRVNELLEQVASGQSK